MHAMEFAATPPSVSVGSIENISSLRIVMRRNTGLPQPYHCSEWGPVTLNAGREYVLLKGALNRAQSLA